MTEHLAEVCEHTAAACLLAGTLKCHRVVAINLVIAGISAMSLESQKAKKWARSSCQSHSFNPTHIV